MKRLHIDKKFALTAALCAALLVVPPLAVGAQTIYYTAPQTRPEVAGVMSDSVRLDPVAGALYRYGIAGGLSGPTTYGTTELAQTVMSGKLRQAANRGLLSVEQRDYLLDKLASAKEVIPFQPAEEGVARSMFTLTYYEGDITEVSFSIYTPDTVEKRDDGNIYYTMKEFTSVDIMYLPDNGAILEFAVEDEELPAGEPLDTVTENFIAQLNTTLPGEWSQTEKPNDNVTTQQYIYKHSANVLWVRSRYFDTFGSSFNVSVVLEPEVYGGLDTLNGITTNAYGQVYGTPQDNGQVYGAVE